MTERYKAASATRVVVAFTAALGGADAAASVPVSTLALVPPVMMLPRYVVGSNPTQTILAPRGLGAVQLNPTAPRNAAQTQAEEHIMAAPRQSGVMNAAAIASLVSGIAGVGIGVVSPGNPWGILFPIGVSGWLLVGLLARARDRETVKP